MVDYHRLAHGFLVLRGRVADIVAGLGSTGVSGVGVDLLGLFVRFVSPNALFETLLREENVQGSPM